MDWLIPPFSLQAETGPAFFAYAHQKRVLVDGKLLCPLVDPLIQASPYPCTSVVFGSIEHPEHIASQSIPRRVKLKEFLFSLLFLSPTAIADLRFLWSLQRPMPRLAFHWTLFAVRTFLIANYMALKMRRVAQQADSAYVVVYYNAVMLGVVSAFRRLGKEAWDVQHGLLGPTHTAYNNARAFAIPSSLQPTGFLVWDESFGRFLENTIHAQWRSTDYLHIKAFRQPREAANGQRRILYTLQWGTPVPTEVKAAIAHWPDVHWVFRKHPFEKSERSDLTWIEAFDNAEITDASIPLADALSQSDVHLTYNSSVVFEAAALQIPSVLLSVPDNADFPPPNHTAFEDAIQAGNATVVPVEKLVDFLGQVLP